MISINFVTGNQDKFVEVSQILQGIEVRKITLDLPELQGQPLAIASEKARIACQFTGHAVVVEDTSLIFNAWNGLPGPYIRHFIESVGIAGLYQMLAPYADKSAYAQVVAAIAQPGQEIQLFIGKVCGQIVPPAGKEGFQFDRIFIPDGDSRRFSEMSSEEKNGFSHRRLAFEQVRQYLLANKT